MKVNAAITSVAIILVVYLSFYGMHLDDVESAFDGKQSVKPITLNGRTTFTRPQALIDDDLEDYGELILPRWLSKVADCDEDDEKHSDCITRLKTAVDKAASKLSSPAPPIFPKHSLVDLVEISHLYSADFGIVMYDPENDDFLLLYNGDKTWVGGILKLVGTFQMLVFVLRYNFPDRFRGKDSDELAIAIGSGDYPHIRQICIDNFPHAVDRAPCNTDAKDRTPILQFSSVYRHAEILPHMHAMPMPALHLPCFVEWAKTRTVCSALSGDLESGGDVDSTTTSFENLINQVVWRGTDFSYLNLIHNNALRRVHPGDIKDKIAPEMREEEKKTVVISTLRNLIDDNVLLPRWKGVALTLEAEHEIAIEDELPAAEPILPWVNIRFSRPSPGNPTDSNFIELADYGIQVIGETMTLQDLAQFKYHIDLGGGGGTTWTGTIQKVAMPGLLFHHVSPTKDYIHDYLVPWIHYIPIAGDLRDLRTKYDWAEHHPHAAKLIAEQGTEFVRHLATPEGFDELYQKAFIEPVRRVIESYEPVPSSSWRDVLRGGSGLKQVMQCTGMPYECDDASMFDFHNRDAIIRGELNVSSPFRDI